jgi:hypothetical protein
MYHKDTLAVLAERTDDPLENLKASSRQIVTMYLTKTIHYSRAIIENTNSRNLLVAFQSMRALVEGVATVRYTIEKIRPIVHLCSTRGTVTAEEARQSTLLFFAAPPTNEKYTPVPGPARRLALADRASMPTQNPAVSDWGRRPPHKTPHSL